MATVSEITNAAATTTTANTARNTALGQDQFLTLLVAQLQNQDPLNPSDPTEFTTQLAQYSQLEQLFNLNDAMETLTTAQNNSQRLSALSLIGQQVVVENDRFTLGSEPVEIGYKLDDSVSSVQVSIQNESGRTVATLNPTELGLGNHFLTWDGTDRQGNALPEGTYSIIVNTKNSQGESSTASPLVRDEVTGIDLSSNEAKIVTALGEFPISSIHGAFDNEQSATSNSSG